jgi:Cdc6-like AAA superfamily ATPase
MNQRINIVKLMTAEKRLFLRSNPFVLTPILEKESTALFVNRTKEVDQAENFLNFHDMGIILIIGDRGIGKTSLLSKVASDMDKNTLVVPMTIHRFDPNRIEFLRGILLSILNELQNKIKSPVRGERSTNLENAYNETIEKILRELSPLDLGFSQREQYVRTLIKPDIYEIESTLDAMLETLLKTFSKTIVIIDDFDKINPAVAAPMIMMLRPLLSRKNLFFILAVSKELWEYLGHEIQIARSISDLEILLQELTRTDLLQILERRLKFVEGPSLEELFDPVALDLITSYAQGNPRELISACSQALDIVANRGTAVTKSIADEVVTQREGLVLAQLDDRQIKILKYIGGKNEVRAGDPRTFELLNVSRSRSSTILNELAEKGMLLRRRKGRFFYYSIPETLKVQVMKTGGRR